MTKDKQQLRNALLMKRRKLSADEIAQRSATALMNLVKTDAFKNAKTVMFYIPMSGEIDVLPLYCESKRFCVPYIRRGHMFATEYTPESGLVTATFDTKEPADIRPVPREEIDLLVCPGLVFGRNFGRVGFGKGYYDVFMMGLESTKYGVCYDFQIFNEVPITGLDVSMDGIICESEVIICGSE